MLDDYPARLSLPATALLAATDVITGQLTQLALTLLLRAPAASTLLSAVFHSTPSVTQKLMQHGRVLRVAGGGLRRQTVRSGQRLHQHRVMQVVVDGEGIGIEGREVSGGGERVGDGHRGVVGGILQLSEQG